MMPRVRVVVLAVLGWISSMLSAQQTAPVLWHMDGWTAANTSFSRNGSAILVWNASGFAVYSATTGALEAYVGTAYPVSGACLAKDGSKVYYGCNYNLAVYNVASQTQSYPMIAFAGTSPMALCLSEDGGTLGFISYVPLSQTIDAYLINLSNNSVKANFPIKPSSGAIPQSMAFVDGGNQVVFDGPTLYSTSGVLVGSVPNTSPVVVSPDEHTLYCQETTASTPTLAAYSESNLSVKWTAAPNGAFSGPAPSANGAAVYVGLAASGNWYVQGYAASTGHPLSKAFDFPLSTTAGELPALAASPINQNVVLGPSSQSGFDALAVLVAMNGSTGSGVEGSALFEGFAEGTYSVKSGAAPKFVVGDNSGSEAVITIRNAHTGAINASLPGYYQLVSPDATYYLAGVPGGIGVFSVASGQQLAAYNPPSSVGMGGSFGWGASSGQAWIACDKEGINTLLLLSFDGTSFALAATTPGIGDSPFQVIYSANGAHVIERGGDGIVWVYDASTGAITATINEGPSRIDPGPGNLIGLSEYPNDPYGGANVYRVFDVSHSATLVSQVSYNMPFNITPADGSISPDGRYIVMDDDEPQPYPETRLLPSIRVFRASDGLPLQEWRGIPAAGVGSAIHVCVSSDSSVVTFQIDYSLFAFALPPTTMGLSLIHSSTPGGAQATGTIMFDSPAPVATSIQLSSSAKAATVPASVTVPAGATSATFTINTAGVDASTEATISAVDTLSPLLSASSTLTVTPATAISLTLNPATVVGGNPTTGTVTLNALAGPSGVPVSLISSSSAAKVPSSVSVPSGSSTATFTVNTTNPPATTTATVTATASSFQSSANLQVVQQANVALTFGSSSVVGGTAAVLTVSLYAPAPSGGVTYSLTASKTALQPPASVTAPAGATSVTIGIPSIPVATNTPVTLSASKNGSTAASAVISVSAPVVTSIIPSGTEFVGPATAIALVELDGPVPANFTLTASSSNAAVSLPATISVPAGQTYALVTLKIGAVQSTTRVTIKIGGGSCTVTVLPV